MSSKAARGAARRATENGRNIFIYTNIRTNQTVYSLQRFLNKHNALAQLAYAGKKTVPPTLRKDVWRPLATVEFPVAEHCLIAYRQLREFRKLHEMHWDNNKQYPMLPPERQKELEEGKSVPTKKERAKIIMDQKANSVADLAAVLRMQDQRGQTLSEQHIQAIVQWTKAAERVLDGGIDELPNQIAANKAKLHDATLTEPDKAAIRKELQNLLAEKDRLPCAEIRLHQAINAALAVSIELDSQSTDKGLELRRRVIEYWLKVVEEVHAGVEELVKRTASMETKLQDATLTDAGQKAIQGQVQELNNHKNEILSEWTAVEKTLGNWKRKLEWAEAPGKVDMVQLQAAIKDAQKRQSNLMAYWNRPIAKVRDDINKLKQRIASMEAKLQETEATLTEDDKTAIRKLIPELHRHRNSELAYLEARKEKLWQSREVAKDATGVDVSEMEREIEDAQKMLQTGNLAESRRALLEQRVGSLTRHLDDLERLRTSRFQAEMNAKLEKHPRKHKNTLAATAPKSTPSTAGVVIGWTDIFDKEYAESWPEAVEHISQRFKRHTPRDPEVVRAEEAEAARLAAEEKKAAEAEAARLAAEEEKAAEAEAVRLAEEEEKRVAREARQAEIRAAREARTGAYR